MLIEKACSLYTISWLNIRLPEVVLVGLSLLLPVTAYTQDTRQSIVYTVKPGDSLTKIAISYGSPDLWIDIFDANRDKIESPDLIHTGQKLRIPRLVFESEKLVNSANEEPSQQDDTKQPFETRAGKDQKTLKKFRQVFEQVVKQENKSEEKQNIDVDHNLDIGGLVINETKSKMGSDFFNVFYKHWNAPENAENFVLIITEQPIPSMGTLVTVKIDNQEVFKTRLQPRYAITEKLAKQAVAVSYYHLNQQLSISSQITSY